MISVTLEAANAYFAGRLNAESWTAASQSDRQKSLDQASAMIFSAFRWSDSAYSTDANDEQTWDSSIIRAVYEQALWLLSVDFTKYPEMLYNGIVKATSGGNSVQFDRKFELPWICPVAVRYVGALGTLIPVATEAAGSISATLLDR
ncbi:MAG: hypothetical protein Q4G68_13265 [Planctomycetia bacterium]|nr:hypothetical protein [Planctomycetia bacterium]